MTTTLTFTGELVVTTCWCGIAHAVPADLYNWAQLDHSRVVYCPLGHSWVVAGTADAWRAWHAGRRCRLVVAP